MSLTKNPRRPRKPRPADIPADYVEYQAVAPIPDRGATVTLRNPQALFAEWDTDATHAEDASQQNIAKAGEFRAAAGNHQREAGQAAEEEMRLLDQLTKAREKRDHHEQQKEAMLTEAQRYAEQAKGYEDRAADKRTAIAVLQQAMNGNGPAPVTAPIELDPTETAEIDKSLANITAAHDELPEKYQEKAL